MPHPRLIATTPSDPQTSADALADLERRAFGADRVKARGAPILVFPSKRAEAVLRTALDGDRPFCFEAGQPPASLAKFNQAIQRRGTIMAVCVTTANAHDIEVSSLVAAAICRRHGFEDTLAWKVEVALTEALANAVLHGNLESQADLRKHRETFDAFAIDINQRLENQVLANRPIMILARRSPGWLTIEVINDGRGFTPQRPQSAHKYPRRIASDPATQESLIEDAMGRGLMLTEAMVDQLRHRDGGRRLDLRFSLAD